MRPMFFATITAAALALACGPAAVWPLDTYCQSGPKYGTHCMSLTDVRAQQAQRPLPPNEPSIASPPPSPWSSKTTAAPAKPAGPPLLTRPPAVTTDGGTN